MSEEERRIAEENARIASLQARWIHGDCIEEIKNLRDNSVRLLLTDPPYGVDFQSNRRKVSAKADKIEGDKTPENAVSLFKDMLVELSSKLKDEAHLLVFTHWRTEFEFRKILEDLGYEVRGSLVWVKGNHSSGDLEGSFAPKHERIIHATKGHPDVSPRVDDVIDVKYKLVTEHPTEKPVEVLSILINCTTQEQDLVVDPFGGCASTVISAKRLSRDFWGCEMMQSWWEDGYKRIQKELGKTK
jgi:site-specific DNA-methyltransferase (adenine-specific)